MSDGGKEKFDEKGMDKHEEKSPQEKSWDEKWRRDPLSALIWAIIFIWAGGVFLLSNLGFLDRLLRPDPEMPSWLGRLDSAWSIVLIGAGVIFLVEVAARLIFPVYRAPVMGTFIFAIVLLAIGLGELVNWDIIWPVIIIGLGLSILARGLRR
ncbi:MAG: hypothetical protein JXA78_18650 [Anaerolineales bacterium]|nr:hypothetical protein [Anaerolineales bacterium]